MVKERERQGNWEGCTRRELGFSWFMTSVDLSRGV